MILTCGHMQINTSTLFNKDKNFKFSGQICVDGIETFLVYEPNNGTERRYYPYSKREKIFEMVLDEFGDKLDGIINELVLNESSKIKENKKHLAKLRKQDKIKK